MYELQYKFHVGIACNVLVILRINFKCWEKQTTFDIVDIYFRQMQSSVFVVGFDLGTGILINQFDL